MSTQGIALQPDFRERGKTNDVPVARLIGFEAKDIADGRAKVVLATGLQHANPMGTLHGGILCDIADAAMGMAFASTLTPEESFTTVELKINFFRPIWQAELRAEGNRRTARPHHRVRRVHYNRGGESIGRESGVHLHGASRPEGCRTVIPVSLQRGLQADCLFPPAFPPQRSRSGSSKGCNA
jgi:uncharacterized protein (TIGR00369 family)